MVDNIVEEIHAIRRKIAEQCDNDMQKIGEYFMQLQKEHPENLVSKVPKEEMSNITAEQ